MAVVGFDTLEYAFNFSFNKNKIWLGVLRHPHGLPKDNSKIEVCFSISKFWKIRNFDN